jgi:hypothetical protein
VDSVHIERIHIRALLSVNFDIDEFLVHQGRYTRVVKGFMLHDVAPMTGGVAYGQKYWDISFPGSSKCFLSPRVPIYWIVGVLEKVGTVLQSEAVFPGSIEAFLAGSFVIFGNGHFSVVRAY